MPNPADYSQAVSDFHRARRRVALYNIFATWTGKSPDLLSYDEVREKLKGRENPRTELREIPISSIVGSVGRYTDFTRGFLPLSDSDAGRWAGVKVAAEDMGGLPPIEVYQVGEAYFVLDGNHRVSIARELGATQIEAYVRQVDTKVPLSPDDQPDDLIIKSEYVEFLGHTALDELIPEADLSVTSPGRYPVLLSQIRTHQENLEQTEQRQISSSEAVEAWFNQVYLPTLHSIRARGLLQDFPGRTEADLYVWVTQNIVKLEQTLGWDVSPEDVAARLAAQSSPRLSRRLARAGQKLAGTLTAGSLEAGPPPGEWRREYVEGPRGEGFVENILVPIGGAALNRCALDQAVIVAQREQAGLFGLHVLPAEDETARQTAEPIKTEFERRCEEAGVSGRMALEVGEVADKICDRARWTGLVVLDIAHPPGPKAASRLGSGTRSIILRCPTPILAVPGTPSPMSHALLAYDGSTKAREALYLTTYLACRWGIDVTVVTVRDSTSRLPPETLLEAGAYAEDKGIEFALVHTEGEVTKSLLAAADERGCDFYIMGGYGHAPLVEAALGSTVDKLLRASDKPVLICR